MTFSRTIRQGSQRVAVLALACAFGADARGVTIAWSPVSNPGNVSNAADPATGFGAVGYDYKIGTYDVTNTQYTEFLNAKDPTGANTLRLYDSVGRPHDPTSGGITFNPAGASGHKYDVSSGSGNHPVNFVTWYNAIRFANWMNNGQGGGDTESGAYSISGGTPIPTNANSIFRDPAARIAIPNENEWYKAAYYDPTNHSYFTYPTGSNTAPAHVTPPGAANSANYNLSIGNLTDVGAYTSSPSPFGTFDQGGNVFQWTETFVESLGERVDRGGSFANAAGKLASSARDSLEPGVSGTIISFRLAMVPEPSTWLLAITGSATLWWWRRR